MTKDEWIWVAIRIFGVYLLVLAVISIPDAIGQIYAMIKLSGATESTHDLAKVSISLRDAALAKGVTAISQLILFSLASLYFLKYGKLIHKLAISENS